MTGHPYYPKEFKNSERRYLPRWSVKNRLLYKLEDDSQYRQGATYDLSATGTCIRIPDYLAQDQKIKMTIYLSEAETITVDGVVQWAHEQGKEMRAGVQFLDISEDTQAVILDYAFELHPDTVVKNWFKGWEKRSFER